MNAPLRVLVAEDDYMLADDIARALEGAGAVVVGPIPTLDEALHLVRAQQVEVAVLDINLRNKLIFPVADALKASAVPIVFYSSYDDIAVPSRFSQAIRVSKLRGLRHLIDAVFESRCQDVVGQGRPGRGGGDIGDVIPEMRILARGLVGDEAEADALVEAALGAAVAAVERGTWTGSVRERLLVLVQDAFEEQSRRMN